MSQILHFGNTFFEGELAAVSHCFLPVENTLSTLLHSNPIFLQLQFLPFLYASEGDSLLVSEPPPPEYSSVRKQFDLPDLEIITLKESSTLKHPLSLEPWGYSQLLAQWATSRGLHCTMPPWDVVKTVNSKVFSFLHSPQLPHSTLLTCREDADRWLKETANKKRILKTAFGVSGRGHLFISPEIMSLEQKAELLLSNEWKSGRPVIAEPWVERILDFSTQWVINREKKIEYVGSTLCQNDGKGQYRSNRVGDECSLFHHRLPFLQEHKKAARDILSLISESGYVGHVGIDAMIYLHCDTQAETLHPIVEINARKTMGWVAIAFQNNHYPSQQVEFCYGQHLEGLLPSRVIARGKLFRFHRNIQIAVREL